MRLASHIDVAAHEDIIGMLGMQRFDLGMRSLRKIQHIVTLEGLVQKRKAQREHDECDNDDLAAQTTTISGEGHPAEPAPCYWLMFSTTRKRALPLSI